MADTTILNGDIGVTWLTSDRNKRLEWIGGTNTEYTMNQIYSAMQTLQDETTTIDDGTCFFADTPVEYQIGKIDQGDNDPWYITMDLMEHVTGGALRTSGWTRATGTNTGIVMVAVTAASNTIDASDEGDTITNLSTSDTGTLLEVISDGGTNDYLIIRPTDSTAGNDFDGTVGTLDMDGSANAATAIAVGATTGEQVWANLYSIGTVEAAVHMYLYQGEALTVDARARVYSWNSTTLDWYGNGHIDICVALYDITQSTWAVIDGDATTCYLNVFARKGGDLYASFEVACSSVSGGRNPIPLQTAIDLDQGHGTQKIATGAWSGAGFTDGEIVEQATTLARGIVDLDNSTSGSELVFFPIATAANGGALTAMNNSAVITGADSAETATASGSPAADGPADATWDGFTGSGVPDIILSDTLITGYGGVNLDIDNDGTDEEYGVLIDCNGNPLSAVYQWLKYITQYGQGDTDVVEQAFTDDLSQADVFGEEYIGATAYIQYTGGTTPANIAEGESVTQATSGATGVVLWHDTTAMRVLLRSTRGTFDSNTINADDDGSTWTTVTSQNFAAKTAAPLGSFAGGTFFGSRGVLITDWASGDANSFILTDATGNTFARPTSLSFTITNLEGGAETSNLHDRVSWFKLTGSGGDIDKDMFGGVTGTPAAGDGTFGVGSTIQYIPDTGSLVVVEGAGTPAATEYKMRYNSWAGTTFTLATFGDITTTQATATTNDTQLTYATGGFNANVKRGDLVLVNTSADAPRGVGYVKTVDSDTQVTLEGAGISGMIATDKFEFNCVPVALDTADDMYVPYIDKIATAATEGASFIDPTTQIFYRVKVRNSRATEKIKPYSSDGDTTSANASVQVTRTEDTVIT